MTNNRLSSSYTHHALPVLGSGIMHLDYGNKGDAVKVPVNQILYFDYNKKKDTLTMYYVSLNKELTFKRSTYGFADCHEVIMDMYARAQRGEHSSHEDYNKDGTRKNGAPLVKDIQQQSTISRQQKRRVILE
jgi:hypothetical protein